MNVKSTISSLIMLAKLLGLDRLTVLDEVTDTIFLWLVDH